MKLFDKERHNHLQLVKPKDGRLNAKLPPVVAVNFSLKENGEFEWDAFPKKYLNTETGKVELALMLFGAFGQLCEELENDFPEQAEKIIDQIFNLEDSDDGTDT